MGLALIYRKPPESAVPGRIWLAAILACLCAGMASTLWSWQLALVPLSLLLALICVFQLKWGLYLLVTSLFFPYFVWPEARAYPADLVLVLLVIGFWLQRAREGRFGLTRTPVDILIAVWLAVLALSLVNAYDLQRGVINWLRHIQLFLLFYAVAALANEEMSRRLVGLMVAFAAILAFFNIIPFIQSGGIARVYGPARIPFNAMLTVVIVYLSARICFERRRERTWLYWVLFIITSLGQFANQSRAALGLSAVGVVIVLAISWRWGHVHSESLPRSRARQIAILGLIIILVVIIFGVPLFESVIARFRGIGNATATLDIRQFIWKTAVNTYLAHPVLGIGLGQVQVWQHILPSLRLDPMGRLTFGLGSHLSFLKYLAETGTLGAIVLLGLLAKFTRLGFAVIRRSRTLAQAGHEIGVSVVVFVIILRTFIEGGVFYSISGMITALFFGMIVNMYTRNRSDGRSRP